jgi:hypothetical protein
MEDAVTVPQYSWWQDALKKGLVLAIIHIFIFLIIYYFFPSKLTGLSYAFLIVVLNMSYCFINAKGYRTLLGGYIDFAHAFKYVLVLLVVSGVIQTLFSALFLLLEPSFTQVMANSQLDTTLYWAQKFGAPDQTLEKIQEEYDPEEMTSKFTASGQLFAFGIAYVLGAVIVALFVRKREPEQF